RRVLVSQGPRGQRGQAGRLPARAVGQAREREDRWRQRERLARGQRRHVREDLREVVHSALAASCTGRSALTDDENGLMRRQVTGERSSGVLWFLSPRDLLVSFFL